MEITVKTDKRKRRRNQGSATASGCEVSGCDICAAATRLLGFFVWMWRLLQWLMMSSLLGLDPGSVAALRGVFTCPILHVLYWVNPLKGNVMTVISTVPWRRGARYYRLSNWEMTVLTGVSCTGGTSHTLSQLICLEGVNRGVFSQATRGRGIPNFTCWTSHAITNRSLKVDTTEHQRFRYILSK